MNHEEKRFHAAVAAMQGLCASFDVHTDTSGRVADMSVEYADAILAALDRTKPESEVPQPDADGWIPHKRKPAI